MIQNELIYKALGEIVKEFRNIMDYSQDDLAKRCNIGRASIANIESGKFNVDFHIFICLSNELGFNVSDVIARVRKFQLYKELEVVNIS